MTEIDDFNAMCNSTRASALQARRCREQSFSSMRSQAFLMDSDEDIDENLGLIEEDVCFPVRNDGDYIELDELTSRVNLVVDGDEDDDQSVRSAASDTTNRFSFFAERLPSTIHSPDLVSLVGESGSFTDLFNPENGLFYLDCISPTDVEMRAISRAFGLHPLTVEDVKTGDSHEKHSTFKNYSFIAYHTYKDHPIKFYILVFKEGVITFHHEPVQHCENVRRRMRQLRDYIDFAPSWIAYALLDDITDSFAPLINIIEEQAANVESSVYLDQRSDSDTHALLHRIGEGRKRTMALLRMLSGKPSVVRSFILRVGDSGKDREITLYLGDVLDHLLTMIQSTSTVEKRLARTHFNYIGTLQMQFVDATDRMTGVLGKAAIVGSVLLPMHLVTSLWGMNVLVPAQNVERVRYFFVILGCILFVVVIILVSAWAYFRFGGRQKHFVSIRP